MKHEYSSEQIDWLAESWSNLNDQESMSKDLKTSHDKTEEEQTDTDPKKLGRAVVMMNFTAAPDKQWRFITKCLEHMQSDEALGHLAAGPLEHFETWDIHNEGTVPSIRRVTNALDAERIAVREVLGYGAPHFPLADHYATDGDEWMYGRGAHGKLTDSGDWREDIDLQKHRYMLEDTRLGLSFLVSVGRWAGVPTPVAQGLLSLATVVSGIDLYAQGRTLENLGLDGLSRIQMAQCLSQGLPA